MWQGRARGQGACAKPASETLTKPLFYFYTVYILIELVYTLYMVTPLDSSQAKPAPGVSGLYFANCAAGPALRSGLDPLRSADDFAAWWSQDDAHIADVLPIPAGLPDRRTLLTEARQLRTAIRGALEAVASGSSVPSTTLFVLNRAIAFASRSDRLTTDDAGLLHLDRHIDQSHALAPLTRIAIDAAEFLTGVNPARLRCCAAEQCGTWYVDTSKGGRRRWCSMALCGNRSKAARYRNRHAATDCPRLTGRSDN